MAEISAERELPIARSRLDKKPDKGGLRYVRPVREPRSAREGEASGQVKQGPLVGLC